MSIDPAGAEPLDWLISLTGAAVVVLAALLRLRRSRSVSARVVNADAGSAGAVEVRLEEPGRGDTAGTSLRARRRSEVGVPLALVAGDRVQVRPPRRDRQHVIFALTPMSMFPGVLALYGLMLIWVGIQLPADASEARPAPVVFAALAVVPFLTAGWFAGRCWFWLTARRVRGTVVDSRPQTAEPTPGWKSREFTQSLISYEIDGHARRRWSRGAYMRMLPPGRTMRVRVDRRNPGKTMTFGGGGVVSAGILATFGFGLGGVMLLFFLWFL